MPRDQNQFAVRIKKFKLPLNRRDNRRVVVKQLAHQAQSINHCIARDPALPSELRPGKIVFGDGCRSEQETADCVDSAPIHFLWERLRQITGTQPCFDVCDFTLSEEASQYRSNRCRRSTMYHAQE